MKAIALMLLALGCAERGNFPGAKSADIIACRSYASGFAPVWVNSMFNDCMEEAGYSRR
jgi:glycogen synthase